MDAIVDIPHCTRQTPGCWWFDNVVGELCMKCPECLEMGYLVHDVNPDGLVVGRLRCRASGCTFHREIRLLEYKPMPRRENA